MRAIDSSLIIRFFSKEPGWSSAKPYLEGSGTIELALVELGNALWKKVKLKAVTEKDAISMLESYKDAVRLYDQKKYLGKALEIALSHNITEYDAIFIAVAQGEGAQLVTCDARQAEIAGKEGVDAVLL